MELDFSIVFAGSTGSSPQQGALDRRFATVAPTLLSSLALEWHAEHNNVELAIDDIEHKERLAQLIRNIYVHTKSKWTLR
jgi:hypothetical protein